MVEKKSSTQPVKVPHPFTHSAQQEPVEPTMTNESTENTFTTTSPPDSRPRVNRLHNAAQGNNCQRQSPQTVHLDKSKPVPDETQANQSALVKFQLQHALSMHQMANTLIKLLEIDSTAAEYVPTGSALHQAANHLSHYRSRIRSAAHNAFQDQKLNRLTAKIDNQQPADTLTLKGHATQMVMTALRNTLIDQGLMIIDDKLNQRQTCPNRALNALFRLATLIELLEVTRFNPLLAYHDIDHTLSVVHGSMALVGGAYDYALASIDTQTQISSEHTEHLTSEKTLALHKTMLFSAAHDSFFEFKPNTIIRHAGRREATSSEGLSARNLKRLLKTLGDKLDHPTVKTLLINDALDTDIDETIFATVPSFVNSTVINGARALAETPIEEVQSFLVRIATAIADLEECLLPSPSRFITKSLLLNQEGSPVVDMSLIEHRSGVLLALSEQDDACLKSALADKTTGAKFAEALGSWHRWMSSQPSFARGRQRETGHLIKALIEQHDRFMTAESERAHNTGDTEQAASIKRLCLAGFIDTLLQRYASAVEPRHSKAAATGAEQPAREEKRAERILWRGQYYKINQAGEDAAIKIMADLEKSADQGLPHDDRLLSLAQILKQNLPPDVSRLTIPKVESFGNSISDAFCSAHDALHATSMRLSAHSADDANTGLPTERPNH
jgi:hypothetical protein